MYAEIDGNTVKLYGTIWGGDGPYIVSAIKPLLAKKDPVNIHVHSPGGSVIDGNLIFNAIAAAKNPTTIINDGLAASMMSIIMLSGKTVKMASNAFVMIHAPSGSTSGNAKSMESTAKVLRSMEDSFLKRLSAKTGKDAEELKDWMNGDNWFTAEEALEAGLIDQIIDPIIEDNAEIAAFQDLKICANLFSKYDAKDREEEEQQERTDTPTIINPKNVEMKLTAESLSALGLPADASEQDVNAAIAKNDQKIKDLEAKQTADKKANAEKVINDAVAAGKILGSEKDTWLADAQSNLELTERMLAKIPVKKPLSGNEKPESSATAEGSDKWTFTDFRKKDPKGLIAMKTSDPERYKALADAEGVKY